MAVLAWGLMGGVRAQIPAAPAPMPALVPASAPASAPTSAASEEELFLEVTLNGQETGLILRFTRQPGTVLGSTGLNTTVQNLRDLELDPQRLGVADRESVNLDDVHGLRYTYDAANQRLALRLDDALRTPVALNARSLRQPGEASVTPGAVFSYDAFARRGDERYLSVANELRYFNNNGVFSTTGVFNTSSLLTQYVRLDSSWVHSDPHTLETWQVGDLISSSLTWSRSLRMGGVQWRKSFDLRPDLLTFPVASLAGSSVVPSAVSLYVNGVRQMETAVPSGPFVINQVSGLSGAGQATLVTRDTAGRAITTVVPLYVDTRLLAEGLTDYSVELGVLRRDYTSKSFNYDHSPALSGSMRRGVTDRVTVEAHGEAGNGVVNGGVGGMWRMGQIGVLTGSVAASAGSGKGAQASIGYQYLSPGFSVDMESLRASRHYSDLGTAEGGPGVRASNRVNINMGLFGGQTLGLSFISQRVPVSPPARVAALSYAATLGAGLYLSVSAYRDFRDANTRGIFFSLSGTFGDRLSANASSGRQNGVQSKNLTLGRTVDYAGGFGWGLQSLENNGATLRQAQGTYLGNYGQVGAFLQESGGKRETAFSASGSVVVMDGSVHAARQVGAGFALVSAGVGGLPVLQENRPIGTTSSSGYLLVPNLTPYLSNQISIDTSSLPLDARIARTTLTVVPARRSGVVAEFPVETYAAATVILHDAAGQPLATGLEVVHVESGATTVTGFDGLAFIDNLAPLNHVQAVVEGRRCIAEFAYVKEPGNAMPTIGPVVCRSVQ
ncbi:fimbrial assembly protein [Duganella sp. Leaf61]|nr:fimbrial assembly protein [Duganella sp. Leaf61]